MKYALTSGVIIFLIFSFSPFSSAEAFNIDCTNNALAGSASGPDVLEVGQEGAFSVHGQYLNSPVYRLDADLFINDGRGTMVGYGIQSSPWYVDHTKYISFSTPGVYYMDFWISMQDGGSGKSCGQNHAAQVIVNPPPQTFGTICVASNISTNWTLTGPSGSYQYTGVTSGCRDDVTGNWTIGNIPAINGYDAPTINPSSATQTVGNGGGISWNITYTAAGGGYGSPSSYGSPTTYSSPSSGTPCNTAYPSNALYVCYFDGMGAPTGAVSALSQGVEVSLPSPVGAASPIMYDWGTGTVGTSGKADQVSAVWRGTLNFQNGTYTFHTLSDDGIELLIDGFSIIGNWGDHAPTQNDSTSFSLNGSHTVQLRFYENGGGATAKLWWDFVPSNSAATGYVDTNNNGNNNNNGGCALIAGWGWDPDFPNNAINIQIYKDGVLNNTISASDFRQDLANAGKGNGNHGFTFAVPASWKDGVVHSIDFKAVDQNGGGTPSLGYAPISSFQCFPAQPAEPGNQTNACNADATEATLSWNAVPGASNYLLRISPPPQGTTANCGGNTYCYDYYNATSYHAIVNINQAYQWWVHSNSCVNYTSGPQCYSSNTVHSFTCTPVVTNYSITIAQPQGGSVVSSDNNLNCGGSCVQSYAKNSSVLLTAKPKSSYWQFDGWGGDCASFGKATSCSLKVDGPKNVTARFITRFFKYLEF